MDRSHAGFYEMNDVLGQAMAPDAEPDVPPEPLPEPQLVRLLPSHTPPQPVDYIVLYSIVLPKLPVPIIDVKAMVKAKQRDPARIRKEPYIAFKRCLMMARAVHRQHIAIGGEAKLDLSGEAQDRRGQPAFQVKVTKLGTAPGRTRPRMSLVEAYPPKPEAPAAPADEASSSGSANRNQPPAKRPTRTVRRSTRR